MNILILTNTFTPHVGGVARSVAAFTEEYRRRGHRVLTIAPEFADMPVHEADVVRVPAIQNFNASDFSVVLPTFPWLSEEIDAFKPDIVHSQHPFLLGVAAVRIARHRQLPLVFTHHTLYEQYTHYVPGDSPALKRFTIELATRYANLSDQVFAPSESIQRLLRLRGVNAPIMVVPTGVNMEYFVHGDGAMFRQRIGVPDKAFIVGHLGRLAPEKNLEFLSREVADFAQARPNVHFLVVGAGPSEEGMRALFDRTGLSGRLHVVGVLQRQPLADALHAMDLFAFASKSETQGMVLTEAMAAALPVVALDAPGVREMVVDGCNGRLLPEQTPGAFAAALQWVAELDEAALRGLKAAARETAEEFSMSRSADKALVCFKGLLSRRAAAPRGDESAWNRVMNAIETEWKILKNVASASDAALGGRDSSARED